MLPTLLVLTMLTFASTTATANAGADVAATGASAPAVEAAAPAIAQTATPTVTTDGATTSAAAAASALRQLFADEWEHRYSRQQAAWPAPWTREHKFWPTVGRVNNAYGDRNLVCSCPPVEEYAEEAAI